MRTPKAERGTITVSTKSWHYRAYDWWRLNSISGALHGGRDNLCHYVRVVLFWAPATWVLVWLFEGRVSRRLRWLHPGHLVTVILMMVSLVIGFIKAPVGTLQVVLTVVGIVFVLSLVGMIVAFSPDIMEKLRRRSKTRDEADGDPFHKVLVGYVRAKKAKVCPFIEVLAEPKEAVE